MDEVLKLNYQPFLPNDKNSAILDFGCGNGRVLKFLHDCGYEKIIGVDISSEVLKTAASEIKNKIQIIEDPMIYLKNNTTRFDCIVAKDVLYYFDKAQATILCRELFSKLKPGGVAIVEVVNGAALTSSYTSFKDNGIQSIFTEDSLAQIISNSDLVVTKIFGQKRPLRNFRTFAFSFIQKIWSILLKVIFIIERGIDPQNPKIFSKSLIGIGHKPK